MSKNNIFNKYPPVIHGEARAENDEFVVHTRYPRFLARKSFDDSFSGGLPAKKISGELVQAGEPRRLAYNSKIGLWLSDFIMLDNNKPEITEEWLEQLKAACDRIAADDLMLNEDAADLGDWDD
ncbi:TPA: anti-CRISPR protein AcrIIC2 [Neisseria meningitidis]